jgi:hypothetical protein
MSKENPTEESTPTQVSSYRFTWKGRAIETLTNEELREALATALQRIDQLRSAYHELEKLTDMGRFWSPESFRTGGGRW